MFMKNIEIYEIATQLTNAFKEDDLHLPMKLNFYLQKNKKVLIELSKEIEESRIKIAAKYGVLNEEGTLYNIPEENLTQASQELDDLFHLEQDVHIYTIRANQISDDIKLSTSQMEAMLFMIEEDQE